MKDGDTVAEEFNLSDAQSQTSFEVTEIREMSDVNPLSSSYRDLPEHCKGDAVMITNPKDWQTTSTAYQH